MVTEFLTMATPALPDLLREMGIAIVAALSQKFGTKTQLWSKLRTRINTVLCRAEDQSRPAIAVARCKIAESSSFLAGPDERIVGEMEAAVGGRDGIGSDSQDAEAMLPLRLERLRRAVDALPEIRGAIFLAHSRDGLPYDAIAEHFGISLADVQRELAAAMASIDAAMDES
ncbi:DNA-directed RNA polymerase specialized sigma24 family protein [Novosphingobium sp. 1748]|uniref:sigma-70 region 4 domain-containing protein n=1 Tax=Novosphingobium sp. 1748 TaxID=2817760 RepID=UPI0028640473|nr:sigma-70 region 4 domain-containing protein [Novosphingobium sp. 1748]MDR6710198.1 DNA-directed RNA polymerase specialized sigma24 family protein [Novosphingobium sp. 1748]